MIVVESLARKETSEGVKYTYFYRLIKSEITISSEEGPVKVQSYGIEIERQDIIGQNIINIERDCVLSISPQRHKVHSLVKILHDNLVSPYHLVDVLGETIDNYIGDFDKMLKEISMV